MDWQSPTTPFIISNVEAWNCISIFFVIRW